MSRRRDAAGFTLIELMIVLSIVGVLLRIALPAYAAIRRDSVASQVAGDVHAIRVAAIAQYEATGSYASDAPGGFVPAGMAAYLPREFSFSRPLYVLDWENFAVSDTSAGGALTGQVLAVTVTATDPLLALQVLRTLGRNCTHWSVGDSHTFVLQSTLESPK